MQKLSYIVITGCVGIMIVSACTKKRLQETIPADKIDKIKVQKVSASPSNISLESRNNWQLFVGSKIYNSIQKGTDSLIATAAMDPFYFEYQGNISEAQPASLYVYYSSRKYSRQFGPVFKESGPNFNLPTIFDQSSVKDLVEADLLIGKFNGKIAAEIANLPLIHANALFEFKVTGIASSDTVYVNDLKTLFRPYYKGDNQYQCIVTGNWFGIEKGSPYTLPPVIIQVSGPGRKYITSFPGQFYPIQSNIKYRFNLNIDYSADALTITNVSTSIWNNEIFPSN